MKRLFYFFLAVVTVFLIGKFSVFAQLGKQEITSSLYSEEDKKRFNQEILKYQKEIEANPNNVEAYIKLGDMYGGIVFLTPLETIDYQEAIRNYQKAIQINPNDAKIHHKISHVYLLLKDFDKAITHAQRAIQLNPDMKGATAILGDAYYYSGQYEQAITYLDKQPLDMYTCMKLGKAYYSLGEYQKTIDSLHKMKIPSASELTNKFLKASADVFGAMQYYFGLAYYKLGKYQEAKQHLREAKELFNFHHSGWRSKELREIEEYLNKIP